MSIWELIIALAAYTTALVTAVAWITTKFGGLIPAVIFEQRFAELEARIRNLELWAAANDDFPFPKGKRDK